MTGQRTKSQTIILLSLTLVAIILLAAALPRLEFLPGQPFPLGSLISPAAGLPAASAGPGLPTSLISWGAVLLALTFILLIIGWLIVFILRPEARKYLLSRLASYLILLLLITGLIYSLRQQIATNQKESPNPALVAPLAPTPPAEALSPPALVLNPPAWLVSLVTLTFITLLLGLAWFFWQRRAGRTIATKELIALEARQTVQAIQAGGNLKDTVLNCYLKMNQILQEQRGIQRQEAMTPREFEQHLAGIGLSDNHIARLTRLFEGVRYGGSSPSNRDEQEAVACSQAIAQAYGQPA